MKKRKLEHGLTQTQLAEMSRMSKDAISRLENSHGHIALMTLKRIVEGGLGKHLEINIK